MQLLITWAQMQQIAVLKTYATGAFDLQLETLARQLFGLSAALLMDRCMSMAGDEIGGAFKSYALERLRLIHSENPRIASRGRQLEILCADHLGMSSPRLVYDVSPDGSAKLKPRPAFLDLALLAIHTTVHGIAREQLPRELAASLAGALYELFRNTEEHARFDIFGNRVARSLRGLQVRHHAILAPDAARIFADAPPLNSYFQRLGTRRGDRQIHFIEVSVFDSGPGLAPRWTATPLSQLSADDEYSAIEDCFRKHATSKTASSAGLGLPTVIDILRKRDGLIRLRTGRYALYADLGIQRDHAYGSMPKFANWNEQRRLLAAAQGTLLTLILPLHQ